MRLLHSQTFEPHEFPESSLPAYAILSHTWGDEEVTFNSLDDRARAEQKAGWKKIKYCGDQAHDDGWDYFWVDTCCIDKSSSAELSESINSMFSWYKKAEICYVYFSDVNVVDGAWKDAFAKSRWWTRGWTLQELIAPSNVAFYSAEWECLGTKAEHREFVSKTARIDPAALEDAPMPNFSIAQRMSWASFRKTTRIEDRAYSLMGIFDVNMPMLYGEGMKAFQRLQEEIIKSSTDQSILAWSALSHHINESQSDIFASSPDEFANSGHIQPREIWHTSSQFTLSNKGLAIQLFVKPTGELYEDKFEAYLACTTGPEFASAPYFEIEGLPTTISHADQARLYIRTSPILNRPQGGQVLGQYKNIVIANHSRNIRQPKISEREWFPGHLFLIRSQDIFDPYDWHPRRAWDPRTRLFWTSALDVQGSAIILGALAFLHPEPEIAHLRKGFALRIGLGRTREAHLQLLYYDRTKISLEKISDMSSTATHETGVLLASAFTTRPSLEIPGPGCTVSLRAKIEGDIILDRRVWVIEVETDKLSDQQTRAMREESYNFSDLLNSLTL